MIILEDIVRHFKSKEGVVKAVDHISLQVERGSIYGIIGYSGAGKSTLLRCINLLENPESGKVLVNDQDMQKLSLKELRQARRKIGMIFQHFHLLSSRTVFDNIAFALGNSGLTKEDINTKVNELLHLVDLVDKKTSYPSELSGGQKQRVAIARALANDPQVLLCDEATSSLDPQTTSSILSLLKELNQKLNLTIVLITHEMDVIKEICHKVAVMENGKIIEEASVRDLFSHPKHHTTQEFIQSTTNISKIKELVANHSPIVALARDEQLLQLRYSTNNTDEALISQISQDYGILVNIIFGTIELIENQPMGWLIVKIKGDSKLRSEAISYLQTKGVEVINYE